MKFLKNILKVTFSNFLGFGTSFLIGFILPAVLSVQDFGYFRQYSLYISFSYFLNLGINDAIYVKYGGKNAEKLNQQELSKDFSFLLLIQTLTLFASLIISMILGDSIFIMFSLTSYFIGLSTFYQNFFQATGEFNSFTLGNVIKTIFLLITLVIQIFLIKSNDYQSYIYSNIASFVLLTIYYAFIFKKKYLTKFQFVFDFESFDLIQTGFIILLANISMTFVANIGSWIVNLSFSIEDFAQYSFQNSLLNVVLLIVNAVGMVFYNKLAQRDNIEWLDKIKYSCLLIGIYSGFSFFILDLVVARFLPKYNFSTELLSLTFLGLPSIIVSKILLTNLYKVYMKPSKYFGDSILFSLFSLLFVLLVSYLTKDLGLITLATSVSYFIWYLYSVHFTFKNLGIQFSSIDIVLSLSFIATFYITSNHVQNTIGMIVYFLYLVLLSVYVFVNRKSIFIKL